MANLPRTAERPGIAAGAPRDGTSGVRSRPFPVVSAPDGPPDLRLGRPLQQVTRQVLLIPDSAQWGRSTTREDRELLAELRRLNSDVVPLAMNIMMRASRSPRRSSARLRSDSSRWDGCCRRGQPGPGW